jgi:hypothetical protein
MTASLEVSWDNESVVVASGQQCEHRIERISIVKIRYQ